MYTADEQESRGTSNNCQKPKDVRKNINGLFDRITKAILSLGIITFLVTSLVIAWTSTAYHMGNCSTGSKVTTIKMLDKSVTVDINCPSLAPPPLK